MEKDIEILENLKEYLQLKIDSGDHKIIYNGLLHDEKTVDCLNALENLLKRYKELEEENKELKVQCENEFNRGFFMKVAENYEKTNAEIVEVKSLFIPISVIQNKIEEYNKERFKLAKRFLYRGKNYSNREMTLLIKVKALQELLEERNK